MSSKNPDKMSRMELVKEVKELRQALVELRDEILPNWSRREAVNAINAVLGNE